VSPLVQKLDRIFDLTPEEKRVIESACTEQRDYGAREDIIHTGDRPWKSNLLLEGMVCRYRNLGDGKRQILAFQYPGDVFDAYSFILEVMDHNIATVAPSRIAFIPHEKMWEIIQNYPRIVRAIWKGTLIDGAVFAQWMTNARWKSAEAQIAHLLCEICERLDVVGLSNAGTFDWPITSRDLEEALDIPTSIIEKTFEDLIARGWVEIGAGKLTLINSDSLRQLAGFDPRYLHHERPRGPAGRPIDWVRPL